MEVLSREEFRALAGEQKPPCISIFMPIHHGGGEVQQNPIRLKNLLRQAHTKLVERGTSEAEISSLVAPISELINDTFFWNNQKDGLALFAAPEFFRYYELPGEITEDVLVNNRFGLKPLLSLFAGDGKFYILAISQNQVRLLEGSRYNITELPTENLPQSLAEVLRFEEFQPQFQYQNKSQSAGTSGAEGAIVHGHGGAEEDPKNQILRYFQMVDRALHPFLQSDSAPLLLAGVGYLFPIYREANTYQHLFSDGINGNPEELQPAELHRKAWEMMGPYFMGEMQQAIAQFENLSGTERISIEISEVLPAAFAGRVGTLFIDPAAKVWGEFDPLSNNITVHAEQTTGAEELVDLTAVTTILNGGRVFPVSSEAIPGSSIVAAVYRY